MLKKFIVILCLISFDVFAFNIGDRVTYRGNKCPINSKAFPHGRVTDIKSIQHSLFLTVYLDSDLFNLTIEDLEDQFQPFPEPPLDLCPDQKQPFPRDFTEIHSYSINLMWINKTFNACEHYLSSATTDEACNRELLTPLIKWAIANPSAQVNLWYDSVLISQESLLNTQNLLKQYTQEKTLSIDLKDIRAIPIVKANPDAFSDQIPIYFRIDLLKVIILLHAIETDKQDAAIFSDITVGDLRLHADRMTKEELFCSNTMKILTECGLLLNKTGAGNSGRTENQFLQLINHSPMIEALKHSIVNPSLCRAQTVLNFNLDMRKKYLPELNRAVFAVMLSDPLAYYEKTISGQTLLVRPDLVNEGQPQDPWIEYHPKKHGYLLFGKICHPGAHQIMIFDQNKKTILSRSKVSNLNFNQLLPARPVDVRSGRDHSCQWSDLVMRPPADGGQEYQVQFWE